MMAARTRRGLLVAAILCAAARVSASTPTEYEVKAAFLYNFAKYVQWPASARSDANAPFVVAVLGRDPFGAALEEVMNGQKVQGRTVAVRRFARVEELAPCDVLFIGASERRNLRNILNALGRAPVLTVGDMEQFAELGGMINLTTEESHVRFEINPAAIERAGLKAGSQLLRLARIVRSR